MIDIINFNHFFVETKHKLTPELLNLLNPYNPNLIYLKVGSLYLSTNVTGDILNILMAVGKGNIFSEGTVLKDIKEECQRSGIKHVKFQTSRFNKTVHRMARYFKAEAIKTYPDFYGPGDDAIEYLMNFENNSRFPL